MTAADRTLCATCAARIAGQLQIGWFSLAMTLAAFLALAHRPAGGGWATWATCFWTLVASLGAAERYVAARLAIDRHLFDALARPPQGGTAPSEDHEPQEARSVGAQSTGATLAALDASLAALGMAQSTAAARPLADRVEGAGRWLRRHTAWVAAQAVAFLAAIVLAGGVH